MAAFGVVLFLVVYIAAVDSQITQLRDGSQTQARRLTASRFAPKAVEPISVQTKWTSRVDQINSAKLSRNGMRRTQSRVPLVQTDPLQRLQEFVARNSGHLDKQGTNYRSKNNRPDNNSGRNQQTSNQINFNKDRSNLNARFPLGHQLPRTNTIDRDLPFVLQNWDSYTEVDGSIRRPVQSTTIQRSVQQPQNKHSLSTVTHFQLENDFDIDDIFSFGQLLNTGMAFGNNGFSDSPYPFEP